MKTFFQIDRSSSFVSALSSEPVSLAEVKAHLRVTHGLEDDYITSLITAARAYAEHYCQRSFIQSSRKFVLSQFPDVTHKTPVPYIYLPFGPTISVTAVSYRDTAGAEQTLTLDDDYVLSVHDNVARIQPKSGKYWPSTECHPEAVIIEYVTGFVGTGEAPSIDISASVPADLKSALFILVHHFYSQRVPVSNTRVYKVPFSVEALLNNFKNFKII